MTSLAGFGGINTQLRGSLAAAAGEQLA